MRKSHKQQKNAATLRTAVVSLLVPARVDGQEYYAVRQALASPTGTALPVKMAP